MGSIYKNIEFTKMQGTGNDFVLIVKSAMPENLDFTEFAKYVCDRKFGVGSDGLLVLAEHDDADFEMIFHNPDGSIAEMCGNGIRCIGKYIYEKGLSKKDKLRIKTGAGILPLKLDIDKDSVTWITVAMGMPNFKRSEIPVKGDGEEAMAESIKLQSGLDIEFHGVSTGNTHAVIFVDDVDNYPIREIGPQVENHEIFPNKTNAEFAQHLSSKEINVRIWERGAGETLSCGTGVCAAAAVCNRMRIVGNQVTVNVPGGVLKVSFDEEGAIYLGGPAEMVFTGRLA